MKTELLARLSNAEEKISSLVTGQISLSASVADATRRDGASISYPNKTY
jgi:hypothetical protein